MILQQYEIVGFKNTAKGIVYWAIPENILRFERVPRAIRAIKQRYGDAGEAIAEEVFAKGRVSFRKCAESLISRVGLRMETVSALQLPPFLDYIHF